TISTRLLLSHSSASLLDLHSFPTRRSSDLPRRAAASRLRSSCARTAAPASAASRNIRVQAGSTTGLFIRRAQLGDEVVGVTAIRSEEHTSELQSRSELVCRLLLEKKNNKLL